MFAPSTTGFGILNFVCMICDGTYVNPLDEQEAMAQQLAAYVTVNDQLCEDIAAISAELATAQAKHYADEYVDALHQELSALEQKHAALELEHNLLQRAQLDQQLDTMTPAPAPTKPASKPIRQKRVSSARQARVPRPAPEPDDEPSGPTRPLPIKPLNEREALPLPALPDEPVIIPAGASERVEKHTQPDGMVQWIAYVNDQPMGGGSAPSNTIAGREAWQWIAEHRALSPSQESHKRAVTTRNNKQAANLELEAST